MYCLVTLGDWLPPRSSATKKAKRCSRSKLAKAIEVLHLGFKQLRNAPSEHRNPGDVIERAIKALSMCPNLVTRSNNLMTKSEEHTSELQSRPHLVCRLLLEKKKK